MLMTTLRTQMKTIMIILVVAFLTTIVFSWGMGGFKDTTTQGVVGTINGEELYYEDFLKVIQREVDAETRQLGEELDNDKLKKLREDAWDNYVEGILKVKEVKRHGLYITNQEIAHIVENFPPPEIQKAEAFQREGVFDINAYKAFLRQPTAQEFLIGFESSVRDYLLEQKLNYYVSQAADISEDEVYHEFAKKYLTAKIQFITTPYESTEFDTTKISAELKMKYYRKFPGKFKQYPQRQFAYVRFKVEPSGQDKEDVRNDIKDLLSDIKRGADFAKLAELWSQDKSNAADGGDLGWFGRDKMVKAFDEAAFNAEKGEVVGPVETKFGVHIIKIEDIREGYDGKEIKARHILMKDEATPQTREDIFNEAFNFSQDAADIGFDVAATDLGYAVDTTKMFSMAGYITGLGRMRMAAAFCFNNDIGTTSDVYNIPQGYVVFKIIDKIDVGTKPFADVELSITKRLKKIFQKNSNWEKMADLRADIHTAEELEIVGTQNGFTVHTTEDSVSPSGKLPDKLPRDADFLKEVFKLNTGEISGIIEGKKGYYIAHVIRKTEIDKITYQTQHPVIYIRLRDRKIDATIRNWVRELRIAADIKDMRYKYFKDF